MDEDELDYQTIDIEDLTDEEFDALVEQLIVEIGDE